MADPWLSPWHSCWHAPRTPFGLVRVQVAAGPLGRLTLRRLPPLKTKSAVVRGYGTAPFRCDSVWQGPGVDLQCGHPCKIPAIQVHAYGLLPGMPWGRNT